MLSYKHIYHAGNFADVHKHLILIALLKYLQQDPRPYTYIDTHSGSGIYDLSSAEANKTSEYLDGIEAIKSSKDPAIIEYLSLIYELNNAKSTRYYPGSPEIATMLARSDDIMHFCELHNNEFKLLQNNYRKFKNVFVHHHNGFEGLLSLCPPKIRRGLVLIDPSYEIKSDYEEVAQTVIKAHKKWPEAIFAIWYPMLKAKRHEEMIKAVNKLPGVVISDLVICKPDEVRGMYGTGMIIVNTPEELIGEIGVIEDALNEIYCW